MQKDSAIVDSSDHSCPPKSSITLKPSYYTADGKTEGESRIEDTSPSLPSVCPVTRWLQSESSITYEFQLTFLCSKYLSRIHYINQQSTDIMI